jgi:predicted Zn-dependent protease
MKVRQRLLPALAVLSVFLAPPLPAQAQGDAGAALEKTYGVVGRDTAERRHMNDELDRIVHRMSAAVGFTPKSAKILGGKNPKYDKEINALALPDGRIYVLVGLMTAAEKTSDPEASVAFVVGHEMTHVVEHHSREQTKGNILGAIGGAILGKILGGGSSTIRTMSDLGGGLLGGHYSRQHEYEADRGGMIGMYRAGYPTKSAIEMMQVLLDKYGRDKSTLAAWFGSHPDTKNRIDRLRELSRELESGELREEAGDRAASTKR